MVTDLEEKNPEGRSKVFLIEFNTRLSVKVYDYSDFEDFDD